MENFNESKRFARMAGIGYLILAIGAGLSWNFNGNIFVDGNAIITTENIIKNEFKFIMAIILGIIGQLGFILLGLSLYWLLKQVNKYISKIMVTLLLVSIPITFSAIIFQAGALVILKRAEYFNVFNIEQIQAISTAFFSIYNTGIHIVTFFWGLWLFPFAYLVYKSNFIPKILGILLVLSGLTYCFASMTSLISPIFYSKIVSYLSIPESLGEVVMMLWLLIKGIYIKKGNVA
jgi:hypothetical protein